jgi:hypothetical protein
LELGLKEDRPQVRKDEDTEVVDNFHGPLIADDVAEIIIVEVVNAVDDPFGQVISGHVKICSPARTVDHRPSEIQIYSYNSEAIVGVRIDYCLAEAGKIFGIMDSLGRWRPLSEILYVLIGQYGYPYLEPTPVCTFYILMVESTHKAEGEYRRIGVARVSDELAQGWETRWYVLYQVIFNYKLCMLV